MKAKTLTVVAGVGLALTLSGCDKIKSLAGGGGAPKGQVVATVDGEEITALELRGELGGFSSRDPAAVKAAQQQALQRIILRKLLAEEARKAKLDKTADYTLQLRRGEEALLAQLYQRKLSGRPVQPPKAEVEAYVASHPTQFANRKVLFVDQLIAAPNNISPDRLRPLKTLSEVRALLDAEGVRYQQNAATLDTLSANPVLVNGIIGLPPAEIFVIPQGGGALLFNQITSSRDVPLTGEAAVQYATNAIRQQKAQETVSKRVADLRKAAEPKIIYNPSFKPPPPAKNSPVAKTAPDAATAAPSATPTQK